MSFLDRLFADINFLDSDEITARESFTDPAGNVHTGAIGGGSGGSDDSGIDTYQTLSDVPSTLSAGQIVYVADEGAHYVETGE